ncbi:hypothetical protein [Teichococcus coralli]|nr:hypothetical protein [Pseudoroseomonas coralli]
MRSAASQSREAVSGLAEAAGTLQARNGSLRGAVDGFLARIGNG